jgi:uncharacterized protein (UPF0332 family)
VKQLKNSKKSEILLHEAETDFNIKNFNKCASASYFSVRKTLEQLLIQMKILIPKRDDKLANILKHMGYENEAKLLLRLYELRKKADYDDKEISHDEAKEALETAKHLIKLIKTLAKRYN